MKGINYNYKRKPFQVHVLSGHTQFCYSEKKKHFNGFLKTVKVEALFNSSLPQGIFALKRSKQKHE